MFKKIFLFSAIIVLVTFASIHEVKAQCPMCKAAIESNKMGSDGKSYAGKGINNGILYLLAMPYVLIGTLWFLRYKQSKKISVQHYSNKKIITDLIR